VRITVLGKSPAWQDPGGACSGYLVQDGGTTVLLDCGNGVFGKLRAAHDFAAVDAVVVSHLHADHLLDLVPFSYALTYLPHERSAPPRLIAPPGARATLRRIVGAWGDEELVEGAFALEEYDPAETQAIGPLRARFQPVPHYVPANAVELTAEGREGRFTFGADSGPSDDLVAFARDTDLLVLEATLREEGETGPRGHLTAREAGEHAARAQAARLVLTHVAAELEEEAAEQARRAFDGPVEVAREGATYEV
jgi:ribonuclease BN (tRNA processing enzyme)